MQLVLCVPDGFEDPTPKFWSAEDNALVIRLGVSALQILKRTLDVDGVDDRVLSALKQIVRSEADDVRRDNETLRRECARLECEVVSKDHALRGVRNECKLQQAREQDGLVEERTRGMRATVENLQQQILSSSQTLEVSTRTNKDLIAQNTRLESERAELARRLHDSEQTKPANECGHANEERTKDVLEGGGFFVRDTSKGAHNLHFHDKLVSRGFLTRSDDGGVPAYASTNDEIVLSFEDKCYKSSNKLGEQIDKFHELRRGMQIGQRADCFLWYSTASIPIRQHRRKSVEYEQLEDGRFCVTGWLGAADVTPDELTGFVNEVLDQQKCLGWLRRTVPFESDVVQCLASAGEGVVKLAKTQLAHVDRLTKHIRELEKERDGLRCTVLETLFRQYKALQDQRVVLKPDHVISESLQTLGNTKRTEADKLIRNRDEFVHLQTTIAGSAGGPKRRKA